MLFHPLTVVVIGANVLGAAMAVPQARKLLTERRAEGVSVTWATLSAAVNAWWGAYGIGVEDWSIIPVSVVSVTAYLVIAVAVVRYRTDRGPRHVGTAMVVTAAVATLPAIALAIDGWATAGILLGALYAIQLAPAVVGVYRALDVAGVSIATWVIAFSEAVLWGVYGFARHDVGLLALAGTGTTMASLVLVRLFLRRPRRTLRPAGTPSLVPA